MIGFQFLYPIFCGFNIQFRRQIHKLVHSPSKTLSNLTCKLVWQNMWKITGNFWHLIYVGAQLRGGGAIQNFDSEALQSLYGNSTKIFVQRFSIARTTLTTLHQFQVYCFPAWYGYFTPWLKNQSWLFYPQSTHFTTKDPASFWNTKYKE